MAFYRVKLFTKREIHHDDKEYCLAKEHPLVGIGWGDENCLDINEYIKNVVPRIRKDDKTFASLYECMLNMTEDDYVWTKIDGLKYALGRIQSPLFIDKTRPRMGAVRKCDWKIIDFDSVPGKVMNYFVGGGRTLVRMNISKSLQEYCKRLHNPNYVITETLDLNDLIHYYDLEDLLGLFLQSKGYYIYPSTNKLSAKSVEYELINIDTGAKACVQCKTGNDIIDKDDDIFKEQFAGYEIFISTTLGKDYNKYDNYGKSITTVYTDELWEWAHLNYNLLPTRIKNYIDITNN